MTPERVQRVMPAAAPDRWKSIAGRRPEFRVDNTGEQPSEIFHSFAQVRVHSAPVQIQRYPVFPDQSCDSERVQEKIGEYNDTALVLVRHAVASFSNPKDVAGPLRRWFHIDVDNPEHVKNSLPILRNSLEKLQVVLEGPINSFCESGPDVRGTRGFARYDKATGRVIRDAGITYNRNIFRLTGGTFRREIVNTVIHESAHLADLGHGEPFGEPISDKGSIKVRGLTTDEALNSAEVYMRFVRDVSSKKLADAGPEAAGAELETGGTPNPTGVQQPHRASCEEPPSSEERRIPRNCETP